MDDETTVCPQCESEESVAIMLIGTTGNTDHFRCRYCGWVYSEKRYVDILKARGEDY